MTFTRRPFHRVFAAATVLAVPALVACTSDAVLIGIERAPVVVTGSSDSTPDAASTTSPPDVSSSDAAVFPVFDASFDATPEPCLADGGCAIPGDRCVHAADASDEAGACYPTPAGPPAPPGGGGT